MKTQYEVLFQRIIDSDTPNPTIIMLNRAHLNRIRAGLNRCKKDYNILAKLLNNDETLANTTFAYKSEDKDNPAKITISIKETSPTMFEIL